MEARNGSTAAQYPSPQKNQLHNPMVNNGNDHEGEWESVENANELERRRRSSPASPGSPRARLIPTSPTHVERERRRHSSRLKAGPSSPRSPPADSSPRQRAKTADAANANRSKMSPLAKRLGDDQDALASQAYPGVVDFSMEGMQLGVSMDDILDPSATRRQGSTAGPQAGANIAPWLMDDASPSIPSSGAPSPSQAISGNPFNQIGQTGHTNMPTLHRLQSDRSMRTTASSRNGSQPSISGFPPTQQGSPELRSRQGSGDSIQTLAAAPQKPQRQPEILPGGGRHSIAGSRTGRFGSTASSASSGPGEKKKGGFLGGLLKRKGTGMSLGPLNDLNPIDGHRSSQSTSYTGRVSSSNSFGSMSQEANASPGEGQQNQAFDQSRFFSSEMMDGMISPLQEIAEPEFTLDMNLDDMTGIIDHSLAATDPTTNSSTAAPTRNPTLANTALSETPTGSSVSSTWALSDALQENAHRSEGSSGSVSSSQPSSRERYRESINPAHNPFTKENPFAARSSNGSDDVVVKPSSPASPHTYSPKHSLPPANQPRRPSQLRNVKMGSIDSDVSASSSAQGRSLQPMWSNNMGHNQPTIFHDPFQPTMPSITTPPRNGGDQMESQAPIMTPQPDLADGGLLAPAIVGPGPAWAAPESWGVEGDEEEPNDGASSSSSVEGDGEWRVDESPASPGSGLERRLSLMLPSLDGRKPPPFGFKSKPGFHGTSDRPSSSRGQRNRTRDGRPSTSARTATSNRPGTSGSAHLAAVPHMIRIYRADGNYSIHTFPLLSTTADIINALSGANDAPPGAKRVTTTNKLYLRERGQDRMLLSSEKPLNIQSRRLQQAGFTEAEHIEELGKEDLATLCRFIYQTPALPVIDPEEESSYDSFEFIDIAGRDLQTIPIFLHLHAHNIIILNVSRNPMTDLPLDFIQACSSLKEIRMTNMALKRVPPSIKHSATLSRLDISSNRIADLESVPLHEITTLLSLKVQNNKLSSIPSYFVQMKALKYLNISNNKFETFPAVVSEMSNLVDLDISFNNIAELPSEMSNLKSLERLLAYGNDLVTFPESFSTLANLRVLDVRRNKLTDLTSVYALPNLATLQADYNNLVTLDAQIGAKVRQFSVPHNSVTRFTLAPLPNMQAVTYALTHLNLSHGKISTLADEALSGLTNLVDLKLDFNQFTRLPSTLDRLVNLEVFSCTDNRIDTFPVGFGRMGKLRSVNCHNNNLREIPGDLWHCGSLRSTNFSSNLLENLPMVPEPTDNKDSRSALPAAAFSVEKIYMGDNHLSSDVFHLLALLPNVKVINLSFNDIYEIPAYTLSRCDQLEELYLSGNKLTSLPSEDLEKLQSLKTLHLNGNRLQTLPSELGAIKSLQHLDVGSNVLKYNIANWPYDWNWNWNTGLRYLNLSGNKRLEIKPTSAQDISHASSLRKELSDFTALTELRVLGLMDVTLRIPSLPDESDTKRVRTSFSDINNMAYGISDMMGYEHLTMFDMVVPNFRGNDNECIFGMFGRPAPTLPSGKVGRFLQETFATALSEQLDKLEDFESVTDAMRRSFLFSNRQAFDYLSSVTQERKRSVASTHSIDEMFKAWTPGPTSLFKTGASGAVVYLVDKTLYCANAGQALVVISRKGEAELLSKNHLSTDREETARIRRAEAWVSTKGYINDEKDMDISRAFGYWHQAPAVNASPEIRVRPLTETDEFVIIGNSALWDCCSYQTAVDIARTERDDPMMAAQKLRDFAISYGAEGSVMVMVVNVSDLFHGRGGARGRGVGSGPQIMPDPAAADEHNFMRAVRRRYEEVGDRTLNRLQQEIEPPQGQIAIVFTDIVNSTHLWDTNASMPTAIKMHHNLMRRQLRLDGGYEVKTEGDSFMVSFQTVTAAILWAFNCQIGLLREEWPRELLECPDGNVVHDSNGNIVERGLRVRMGIHWGAPQCERDPITRRMDYYGPMVNRAARINASADGGQLMASQDVIYEIELLRDYLDSLDDEGLTDLPAELKREVQEMRLVGIEIRDMGERKLKGLEVPEKLHLLYPKSLVGRLEISNDIRANVEVNARTFHSASRSIDIEQVRELSTLILRLEALSAAHHNPPHTAPPDPTSPKLGSARLAVTTSTQAQSQTLTAPPSFLGPCIREDMTDEELTLIIESLTTRAENTVSTLYFKHLGGFSSVLAALEQATNSDPRLILHALSLMNGST